MTQGPPGDIGFGVFVLSPTARTLTRDGERVALGGRSFDILAFLAARPNEVVSKDDLIDAVWGGRAIEENNLTVNIAGLRRALGDPTIVRTMPGRGYMFVPPEQTLSENAVEPVPSTRTGAGFVRPIEPIGKLIGRDAEVAELIDATENQRLVTVVGIGGLGKTRLANEIARRTIATGRAAIWTDLTTVAAGDPIGETVAVACGAAGGGSAEERIVAVLSDIDVLLVLDSCEHVPDAGVLARTLLHRLPPLRILATSRGPLELRGEHVYRLRHLSLPAQGAVGSMAAISEAESVRFFVATANSVSGYLPTDNEANAVADICIGLDGIALGLQMAAGWLGTMTLAELRDQLRQRGHRLTYRAPALTARHRSLANVLEWSYGLLGPAEQDLLMRMSVLTVSADLETVVAIATENRDQWSVLERLSVLTAKSLVVTERSPYGTRYRLLETVRTFASEKLATTTVEDAIRGCLASHMAMRCGEHFKQFYVGNGAEWLERALPDIEHIRAALRWCLGPGNDPLLALHLAVFATPLWSQSPYLTVQEPMRLIAIARERCDGDIPESLHLYLEFWDRLRDLYLGAVGNGDKAIELSARLEAAGEHTLALGALWMALGGRISALSLAEADQETAHAVERGRRVPRNGFLAVLLMRRGQALARMGRTADCRNVFEEAMNLGDSLHWITGVFHLPAEFAETMYLIGAKQEALAALEERVPTMPVGVRRIQPVELLACLLILDGRDDEALPYLREISHWLMLPESQTYTVYRLRALSLVCLRLLHNGFPTDAARLFGHVRSLTEIADRFVGPWRDIFDRIAEGLRALDGDKLSVLLLEGGRMPTAEATSYLMRWDLPSPERRTEQRLPTVAAGI